jgi:hypothetical protein
MQDRKARIIFASPLHSICLFIVISDNHGLCRASQSVGKGFIFQFVKVRDKYGRYACYQITAPQRRQVASLFSCWSGPKSHAGNVSPPPLRNGRVDHAAKLEQHQSAGGISVGVSKCRFSERLYKKLPQSRGAALNFLQRVRVGDEGYPSVLVHLVR